MTCQGLNWFQVVCYLEQCGECFYFGHIGNNDLGISSVNRSKKYARHIEDRHWGADFLLIKFMSMIFIRCTKKGPQSLNIDC